MQLQEEQEKH